MRTELALQWEMVEEDMPKLFKSIEEADATKISDKEQLLSAMVEVFGSIDSADSRIRSLMREKIPFNSYRRHADYTGRKNVDSENP